MKKTAKELKDEQIDRILNLAAELQKKGLNRQKLNGENCVTRAVLLEQLEREHAEHTQKI